MTGITNYINNHFDANGLNIPIKRLICRNGLKKSDFTYKKPTLNILIFKSKRVEKNIPCQH